MKKQLQKNLAKFALATLIGGSLLLLAACSKGSGDEPQDGDMTEITVNLAGIEGEISEELLLSSSVNGKARSQQLPQEDISAYTLPDFDAQVAQPADDDYAVNALQKGATVRNTSSGKRMVAVPLGLRVRYRIVLYRANGTFHASQQGIVGTQLRINVARGETYRWYAYSYNDTLPVADLTDYNNPVVPTSVTRDLITATGTQNISASGNTPLNIVMLHRTNRVAVEINTMGMFSTLTGVTVTLGGNYFTSGGSCNLLTGAVTGGTTATSPVYTVANLPNLPGTTTGDQKVAYYYTVSNTAIPTMRVTLSGLSVTPYGTPTARNFTSSAAFQFNVTAFTTAGRSKKARIDLIESPLTLGSARWARSNLFLNGGVTTGHNPYRFYSTNAYQTARESYWPWRGLTPGGQAGTGDPCGRVYPVGAWRTPLPEEYQSILSTAHTFGTATGRPIIYTTSTGTVSPYPSNQLSFYANGFGNTIALINDIVNIGLDYNQQGTRAHLWADDQILNVVAGIGTFYYLGTNNPGGFLDPAAQNTQVVTALLNNINVPLLGINILSAGYRNVRCVRNPTVPTTTVP